MSESLTYAGAMEPVNLGEVIETYESLRDAFGENYESEKMLGHFGFQEEEFTWTDRNEFDKLSEEMLDCDRYPKDGYVVEIPEGQEVPGMIKCVYDNTGGFPFYGTFGVEISLAEPDQEVEEAVEELFANTVTKDRDFTEEGVPVEIQYDEGDVYLTAD